MSRARRWWMMLVAPLALPGAVVAQQDQPEETAIELELGPDPALEAGMAAAVRGVVDTAGLRFIVGGLSVTQPAVVTLLAESPSDQLRLTLAKYDWTEPERAAATDADGLSTFRFRTEGAVLIDVRSMAAAAPFVLVAWAGEEASTVSSEILVRPEDYRAGGDGRSYGESDAGGSSSLPLFALLAIVAIGGLTAGAVLSRRKAARGARVGVLILVAGISPLFLVPSPASAQAAKNFAKIGLGLLEEAGRKAELGIPGPASRAADFDPLTEEDAALDPDYDPPGQPDLPSLCLGSRECENCFREPHDKLQLTRYRFEKLRRVYTSTKNMTDRSIAFGDAAASGVGVGGLAWVSERRKIEEAVKNLQASYDNKYAELMDELYDALIGIAECEAKAFGEENWYERYGFMYFQFMSDHYLRVD